MKKILTLGFLMSLSVLTQAQTAIGTTTIDNSAMLDITANNRGILTPRLTKAERNAISTPANGLLIYQTDDSIGFTYFKIDHWEHLASGFEVSSSSSGGAIIPFASGTPVTVTTILGGAVGTSALLGFGNSVSSVSLNGGGNIDLTGASGTLLNFAFSAPRTGTITSIAAYFSTTLGLSLIGTTITITAQLYRSTGPNNTFSPVLGSTVTLAPTLTATVGSGQTSNGIISGLNIPVTAQERYLLVISATATGISLINSISGYASGGINLQ